MKRLIIIFIALTVISITSCQREVNIEKIGPAKLVLPADYMYTLTIPEIMELKVAKSNHE